MIGAAKRDPGTPKRISQFANGSVHTLNRYRQYSCSRLAQLRTLLGTPQVAQDSSIPSALAGQEALRSSLQKSARRNARQVDDGPLHTATGPTLSHCTVSCWVPNQRLRPGTCSVVSFALVGPRSRRIGHDVQYALPVYIWTRGSLAHNCGVCVL